MILPGLRQFFGASNKSNVAGSSRDGYPGFFEPDCTAKSSVTVTMMIALWGPCMLISCRNFAYRVMHNFGAVRRS